jgi:hypothetical protein
MSQIAPQNLLVLILLNFQWQNYSIFDHSYTHRSKDYQTLTHWRFSNSTKNRKGGMEWFERAQHDKTKQNNTSKRILEFYFLCYCPNFSWCMSKTSKDPIQFTFPNHLCDFPFVQLLINVLQVLIINLIHRMPMSFDYYYPQMGMTPISFSSQF